MRHGNHRRKGELGASVAEAALCFALFFIVAIGVIDWGTIYAKRMMINLAFLRATRAGAMPADGCLIEARNQLVAELGRFGNFLPVPNPANINGVTVPADGSVPLARLQLSTTVQLSCITCPILFGSGAQINYTLQSEYPFQEQTSRCAAGVLT